MHLSSVSPQGVVTMLNLERITVWRLELAALGSRLSIGLRYITGSPGAPTSVGQIVSLDTNLPEEEYLTVINVAKVGFPKGNIDDDKARLAEAMKIVHNTTLKPAAADELIGACPGLADCYYGILQAIRAGATASGDYQGWRWTVAPGVTGHDWFKAKGEET